MSVDLSNFNWRKKIPVEPRPSGQLSDYPMLLTVYSGSGTDSPGVVYLNNHSNYFPSDLRVVDSSGNIIPIFIENDGNPANIWVKIPTIDSSSKVDYYIYYGYNSPISSASNGYEVFDFFELWDSDHSSSYSNIIYNDGVGDGHESRAFASGIATFSSARILNRIAISGTKPTAYSPHPRFGLSNTEYPNRHPSFDDAITIALHVDTDLSGVDSNHCGIYLGIFNNGSLTKYGEAVIPSDFYTFRTYETIYSKEQSFVSAYLYSTNRENVIWEVSANSITITPLNHIWRCMDYISTEYRYKYEHNSEYESLLWHGWRQSPSLSYLTLLVNWMAIHKYYHPEPVWDTPGPEEQTAPPIGKVYTINTLLSKKIDKSLSFHAHLSRINTLSLGITTLLSIPSYNLQIYHPSYSANFWCLRWDEGNWSITLELLGSKESRNTLLSNITPGAVSELYNILGQPKYIDTTFTSGNTFWLIPKRKLANLRDSVKVACKNYSDTLLRNGMFRIKMECVKL